ncbi:MAG: DUF4296 domain-containing protein [Ferruginibacter sp.]
MPAGILKPDKMQTVLWDIIKADAFTAEIIRKDPLKNVTKENLKLQQEIFAIHKITKDNFYKSYDYYKENPGQLKVIMDSMIIQAERNKSKNFTIKSIQGS